MHSLAFSFKFDWTKCPICEKSLLIQIMAWNHTEKNHYLKQWWPSLLVHMHDDVIKWKHFPHYWPFVRGIHRSPVNSTHKSQWRGALLFTLICAPINGWVNNCEAGDLRHNPTHYDVIVMVSVIWPRWVDWSSRLIAAGLHDDENMWEPFLNYWSSVLRLIQHSKLVIVHVFHVLYCMISWSNRYTIEVGCITSHSVDVIQPNLLKTRSFFSKILMWGYGTECSL